MRQTHCSRGIMLLLLWAVLPVLWTEKSVCLVVDAREAFLVNHQCHSYNDLREWPQMFSKGSHTTLPRPAPPKKNPSLANWSLCTHLSCHARM
jgi:hypothetical protein